MTCEFCIDPDGEPCFPIYGVAPHSHDLSNGIIGSTKILPKEQWPSNFLEDKDEPGLGIYWCPKCGEGKPENA